MLDSLNTTDAVIDALGGTGATATLLGDGYYPQRVSNWRKKGRFPPDTFLVMSEALRERGKVAPSSLWNMLEPAGADASTGAPT